MEGKLKLLLGYSLFIVFPKVMIPYVFAYGHKMSDLLRHQIHHQISLTIPAHYYEAYVRHPSAALDRAVEFLQREQAPFRLFFNKTKTKAEKSISPLTRFVKNQAICLVFVVVRSKLEVLDLFEGLSSCSVDHPLGSVAVLRNTLIQLVVDESGTEEIWEGTCELNIRREFVPLYFLLLFWSGNRLITSDASLIRETCACDDGGSGLVTYNAMTTSPTLQDPTVWTGF